MTQLAISSANAGRPADSIRWAEAALELDPNGRLSDHARRLAAAGYSNLGRLDDAERHIRGAVEHAPSLEMRVQALAELGSYQLRRGALDDAEQIARQADSLLPGIQPLPWIIIGQVEKARGRLEQAIQAFEQSTNSSVSHIAAHNRQLIASTQRELATLHAELGRGDVALAFIREASRELKGDKRHEPVLAAAAAFVHASRGERDQTLAQIASACDGLEKLPQDLTTQRSSLYHLGRAALVIDERARAESLFHDFLAVDPEPLYYPLIYFHLAECRRRAGDETGARAFDLKAASFHLGTRWERLARERLAAEGSH